MTPALLPSTRVLTAEQAGRPTGSDVTAGRDTTPVAGARPWGNARGFAPARPRGRRRGQHRPER